MDIPVTNQILVLVILMTVGFLSFKLGITTKEAAAFFSSVTLKIALPCMLINIFNRPFDRELLAEAAIAVSASIIYTVCALLFAWFYPYMFGIKGPERGVHRYALVISNSGFIGYPVVEAIMGPFYLFHAAIYNVPNIIVAFSIAAWLIAKEGGKTINFSWRFIVNPPLVTTIIGFVMFMSSFSLPGPLEQSTKLIGSMVTPLSMMVIGISIAQADIKALLGSWRIYLTVFARLLFIPALVGLVCFLIGIRGHILMLLVIIVAMPAGSTTSILASIYDVATEEAGSIVGLSTILSAVTIPLTVIAVYHFF